MSAAAGKPRLASPFRSATNQHFASVCGVRPGEGSAGFLPRLGGGEWLTGRINEPGTCWRAAQVRWAALGVLCTAAGVSHSRNPSVNAHLQANLLTF